MATAEYNKRFREKRKEKNLCAMCGKQDERTLAGYTRCNSCAEKLRQYGHKLKEQHRCTKCGEQDDRTLAGKTRCEFCSQKAKLLYRENKLRKMNGRTEK